MRQAGSENGDHDINGKNIMILLLIADGRSIHTQRWAEFFALKGHTVHLVTYDPMNRTIPGVTEHVLNSRWKNLYLSFLPRHFQIKKIIREIHPDLIHAHFIAKYGFHLPGLAGYPRVVSAWGDDVLILPKKSRTIFNYTKKVLKDADLVYAVSHDIQGHIIRDFGISESKIRYLPFGIDTDLFSPPLPGQTPLRETIEVFSNRGFFPVYDNETLVRGFARAYTRDSRLRLILKGEGHEEQKIRDLIVNLGLPAEIVTFQKKTVYSQVPNDYRQADIFITTSQSDGTPVSVLEAMASGIPCIATAVGGIPEWVNEGVTGLLIQPRSPERVASAILLLASDRAMRNRMGTAARERILPGRAMENTDGDGREGLSGTHQNI